MIEAPMPSPPTPAALEYISALDLSMLSASDLAADGSEGVFLEPAASERIFTRREPSFVDDPDGTAMFGPLPPMLVRYAPPFIAVIARAQVVGYRTVVWKDHFTNDEPLPPDRFALYIQGLHSSDPFRNEDTGLRPVAGTTKFVLDEGGRPRVQLPGTTILLTSHEPSNYGSWLFRALPKVQSFAYISSPSARVLAYAHNTRFIQSFACCGIGVDRLIAHDVRTIYEAERLVVPCCRNSHAYLDPETRLLYGALRARFGQPRSRRRIYVSRLGQARRAASGRVMQNEAALIAALIDRGFDIIEPETLSFEQQIAAFSSAGLVVGPSGSGMFNVVFCHPGTRVIDIESEPHWIHAHLCLFSSCELDFGIFIGAVDEGDPSPVHRRWNVNVKALLDRIAE